MPETCENWFSCMNSCVYYTCQTSEIYQELPYSVKYYFEAPEDLYVVYVFFFGIKDL